MNLSKLAVKRPVTITMMVLVVVLLGAISLTRLPIDLYPEMEFPIAIVYTTYSGVGPQEVESLITKPVEGAIASVGNIVEVSSMTSQGTSIVVAEFNDGTNMDFASLDMREKVDLIKGLLPEDADEPMVMLIDPNSTPIYQISLSAGSDLTGLQTLAEDTFKQRFERLDGVASVDIQGGVTEEIQVIVDQEQLLGYGVNSSQLAQLLGAGNLNLPGGSVDRGEQKLTIRVVGEFRSLEEIKDTPITLSSGEVINIREFADVVMANKETSSISRSNGNNSINISIQKQSGKNTVQVGDDINREIEKLRSAYPDVQISVIADNSAMIRDSINNVVRNVIIGGLLAILILYIFLKNIRTTLIIGTSIPISVVASFILLYFNGITLNIMTLGGLALAVGMLVDNAIVVLENIYRYRVEGYSKKEAAIKGTTEVAMAVTASTITTIAVFLPIVFVEGMVGNIFKDFSMTVTLSLIASLLVSLTLIPMLSSKILTVDDEGQDKKKKRLSAIYEAFDRLFARVEGFYHGFLEKSLKRRKSTVILAVVIFVVSIASMVGVGMEFFPAMDEGRINIDVKLPLGSSIQQVDHKIIAIEEKLVEVDDIEYVYSSIGGGNILMGGSSSGATGSLSIVLSDSRSRATSHVAEEIRGLVRDIPGAEISVIESSITSVMGAGSTPININIKGDELDVLEEISNDFKRIAESVEGTREVKTSLSDAIPEVEILVNKENAAAYGLTAAQVASAVRGETDGMTATKYRYQGEELDVVIKPQYDVTNSLSNLEYLTIATPMGVSVPLNQVAEVSIEKGPVQINRVSQERVVSVTSQIVNRDVRSISQDIEKALEEYEMPEGYHYEFAGENEEVMEAFGQLFTALIMAILLIYMVMAAQFESLLNPFIIMFTIPLAFSGGALALFLTGKAFSVVAFIGIIMLAGIVVNNGIVLIDYINTLRKEGKDREAAIMTAGPVRLRPILMTTLTTVLGLVPLALGIGDGAELQAPMAIVVIGGLTLSTLLTLVVVPIMYTLLDDLSNRLKAKMSKGKAKA